MNTCFSSHLSLPHQKCLFFIQVVNGSKFHQEPELSLFPSLSLSLANQSPDYFNSPSKIYPIQSTSLHLQSHYFILGYHQVSWNSATPLQVTFQILFNRFFVLQLEQFPLLKSCLIVLLLCLKSCSMSTQLLTWATKLFKFWHLSTF